MNYLKTSLKKHYKWQGKIEIKSRVKANSKRKLSLAYTPGVASACLEIQKDIDKSYDLTRRWNTIAVVTDGTAVLGLGDIGPEAGMPVMEGKCVLFKEYGDVDAIPLCIRSKDVDEIVNTISLLAGSFGGINLEDISAPRCFEIEKRLKDKLDIPVFHDDQHGTAIVVCAGLINALKVVDKKWEDVSIVINGAGSAGIAIARLLLNKKPKDIVLVDKMGALDIDENWMNDAQKQISKLTNKNHQKGNLKEIIKDKDIFIGVSSGNIVDKEMIKSMNEDAIVFALANPVPEIMPKIAKKAGARIVASGRSDYPNQVNNVLVFPGLFRGTLDARAKEINEEMKMAAADALADLIDDEELNEDNIIPLPFDEMVKECVSTAVKKAAFKTGVARIDE